MRTVLFFYSRCISQAWRDGWRRVVTDGEAIWILTIGFQQMVYQKDGIFLLAVPLAASQLLSRMYPNGTGLTETLLPFDKEERIRLIRQGFFFRVALSVAVYLVFAGFTYVMRWAEIPVLLGILAVETVNFLAVNSYYGGGVKKRKGSMTVWECILQLLTCVELGLFALMRRDGIIRLGEIVLAAAVWAVGCFIAGRMIKKGRELCED